MLVLILRERYGNGKYNNWNAIGHRRYKYLFRRKHKPFGNVD